ncbi:hypothetical protein Ddye_008466 [Dipteronia dyeriana]|uniref:Protein FAR1-RELATED SEQUENCE n=1 Tax=Dipteronia dyeriana TaxID=168575 RepID=A0AAD9X9L4_9ROSI|nr:hypothetical protein Ddye_008466 [Dipteronia dyeriana]
MLIEPGKVYTKIIFEEFQDEFMSAFEFYMKGNVDYGEDIVYTVVNVDTSKEFCVIRKKIINSLSYSCKLFEMNKILCDQAIKILREVMNLRELPNARLQRTTWYMNLCSNFTKISSRSSESEETYKVAVEHANELSNIIEEMLSTQLDGTSHENDVQGSVSITDNDSKRV